jgi:hypothetical protein
MQGNKKLYKTAVKGTLRRSRNIWEDITKRFLREMAGKNVNSTE